MSQQNKCSNCGNPIHVDTRFCPYCGKEVTPAVQSPTASGQPSASYSIGAGVPPTYGYSSWDSDLRKWIDWTKTGLLLLLIGIILVVIPFIGIIGGLLELVGALLIVLGRKAFGERHSKFVLVSLGIYIIGLIAIVVIILGFVFSFISAVRTATNPSAFTQLLNSSINQLFLEVIVASGILTLSYVLFTYAIQNTTGRILLWTAYGLTILVQIVVFQSITQTLSSMLNISRSSQTFNPNQFLVLETQIYSIGLLNILPYAFYAAAYYLLWSRINRGEIPALQSPQSQLRPTS